MANIILAKEIRKAFTYKVNEFIAQGFEISIGTMSGHQGEVCKVDVTDGTSVYRINLEKAHCIDEDGFFGDKIVLTVEKHDYDNRRDVFDTWNTIWTGRGEEVYKEVWYDVSRNGKAFVKTIDEAIELRIRNHNRNSGRYRDDEVEITIRSEEKLTAVRDMCRTHRGYARVKRAHIDRLVKVTSRMSGNVWYKVYFTDECGKDALVLKRIERAC